MTRRISSLALGVAIACFAASALAQEEGGDAAPAEGNKPGQPAAAAGGGAKPAASTDALPAGKRSFGKSGQVAISQDFELKFESRWSKSTAGSTAKTTTISLGLALDYFVADSISIGGKMQFTSVSGDGPEYSTVAIGPRVGYNLSLGDKISLWPKVSFIYGTTTYKSTPDDIKLTKVTLGLDVPVLFHPAEHFFIGLGPYVELDLSSKAKVGSAADDGNKDTAFGARTVVGGWF